MSQSEDDGSPPPPPPYRQEAKKKIAKQPKEPGFNITIQNVSTQESSEHEVWAHETILNLKERLFDTDDVQNSLCPPAPDPTAAVSSVDHGPAVPPPCQCCITMGQLELQDNITFKEAGVELDASCKLTHRSDPIQVHFPETGLPANVWCWPEEPVVDLLNRALDRYSGSGRMGHIMRVGEHTMRYEDFQDGTCADFLQPGSEVRLCSLPPLVVQLPQRWHSSHSSDHYIELMPSVPLLGAVKQIKVEWQWVDQGWGNQKGSLKLEISNSWSYSDFGIAPHTQTTVTRTVPVPPDTPNVHSRDNGAKLMFKARVGGGGGHQLYINKCVVTVEYA